MDVTSSHGRTEEADNGALTGDLSAILIDNLPWWCEFRRTPARSIALMADWEEKIERMARSTIEQDVRIVAGVPSWTQVLLERILDLTGKDHLGEVWPHLQLYMHGGVSFDPSREAYDRIMPPGIHTIETYNASEGFFSIQDRLGAEDMLLMLDYGIHYEFLPFASDFDPQLHPFAPTIGLAEVDIDTDYAVVISTNGGLHRYVLGDLVRFTSTAPYRIRVTGRTRSFLNLAGEELMVGDAERAWPSQGANSVWRSATGPLAPSRLPATMAPSASTTGSSSPATPPVDCPMWASSGMRWTGTCARSTRTTTPSARPISSSSRPTSSGFQQAPSKRC